MATYFIDYLGGNNANDGLSFANRKKTLTNLAATAGAGDTVRVMQSPAPTSIGSATWANTSKTVTVASGLTANIDLCESAWTPAANVTATAVAQKQGTNGVNLAIAAAFATGIVARKIISATDFSAYQQVSFWFRTTLAFAAGVFELRLCSDTAGTVTVNTIAIPAVSTVNLYTPITVDTGGALGASIQSVALYALSDPGTITVRFDNILACKASSSADSITLTSLLGKNVTGETWHAIQSINGTTVLLDNGPNELATAGRGYAGVSETVTTYKRETHFTAISATSDIQILGSGVVGNPLTISGGWDSTNMTSQTGETWISMHNGAANGPTFTSITNVNISKFNVVRASQSPFMNGACSLVNFTDCSFNNSDASAFTVDTVYGCSFTRVFLNNNDGTNIIGGANWTMSDVVFNNNTQGLTTSIRNSTIRTMKAKNNTNAGISCDFCEEFTIYDLSTSDNATGITLLSNIKLINWNASEVTEVNPTGAFTNFRAFSHNHDGSQDNHKIFTDGGQIVYDTGANKPTGFPGAWKFSPTSSNRSVSYPLDLQAGLIACEANQQITLSVKVMRNNTGITAKLFVRGGQVAGIPNDVSATASGSANVYETLTISFTPTVKSVVAVEYHTYGGTTFSAWFSKIYNIQIG